MLLTPTQHKFYEVKISKGQMPIFEAYDWLCELYGPPGYGKEWDWVIGAGEGRIFYFRNKQDMSWFMLRWA